MRRTSFIATAGLESEFEAYLAERIREAGHGRG
jgi:hypothetical protein